ncbi:MAG: hypothetical protein KF705_06765 [Phycisphaeraceae bacterium]|nr:hypothetical protein [Phycisphaeraceae bacterium]
MTNPTRPPPDPTNPKPSLDALAKRHDLDEELDWAKAELLLETLDTRGRDALDFHEIPVSAIRDVVRHAFESGTGRLAHRLPPRQVGRLRRARGKEARQPRNPDLVDRSRTDPTT